MDRFRVGRLSGRARKRLAGEARRLRPGQGYRALRDVLKEAVHLGKSADFKARLAVTLLGPLNAVFLALLMNPQIFASLRPWARVPAVVAMTAYGALAVRMLLLAIQELRPSLRSSSTPGRSDPDAPRGLRWYEDILRYDPAAYVRAWNHVNMSQLQAELAAQVHTVSEINAEDFGALGRLYQGLQLLMVLAVLLVAAAAAVVMRGPRERIVLPHGRPFALGGEAGPGAGAPPGGRDWARFPPVVDLTTPQEIVALGDVHGGYGRLVDLLRADGLIQPRASAPGGYSWAGGKRILVSVGDLIDKGDQSLEVLDLMMSLEREASAAGGEVVVTLGNHEAEFLAEPGKKKALEFERELEARGIEPLDVAAGREPHGKWIMERPLAARVNAWFFAHAGRTGGLGLDELGQRFRALADAGNWRSPFLVGPSSILEAREWWRREDVDRDLAALHAAHIVFGHDPSAFHTKGEIVARQNGRLFLIDVGMSPAIDYSKGELLVIDRVNTEDVATVVDAAGARREIWRGPAARQS